MKKIRKFQKKHNTKIEFNQTQISKLSILLFSILTNDNFIQRFLTLFRDIKCQDHPRLFIRIYNMTEILLLT